MLLSLKKTESSLIGKIDRVIIADSLIFVLDARIAKKLFVFRHNGQFVRTIGSQGKGEGEYKQLS